MRASQSGIRSLAVTCEFNDHLETVLKDKFVTGSYKGPVLDKLFELVATSTFAKCVEAALKREMTTKQKSQTLEINKMFAKRNYFSHKNKPSKERPTALTCYACGKPNHNFKNCRYKTFKCTKCNKIGHIAAICHNGNRKNSNYLNAKFVDNQRE